MSVHIKGPQVVEISGALHYDISHSLSRFGTLNAINQPTYCGQCLMKFCTQLLLFSSGHFRQSFVLASAAGAAVRLLGLAERTY